MADKPILFSGPMVRAILEGRKTMTRRVLKPQPKGNPPFRIRGDGAICDTTNYACGNGKNSILMCKFKVGDRLWVRERFIHDAPNADAGWDDEGLSFVEWDGCGRKLGGIPKIYRKPEHCIYMADPQWAEHQSWKWRQAIFMPHWASRITLEVTAVKVERLQDISEEDAKAEGVDFDPPRQFSKFGMNGDERRKLHLMHAHLAFRSLWESINGPGSWEANPWVAAYTFKRLTP